jgi:TolB-like protein/DNA-binding winged helix-turn-helix (wHTH) protein/Tfp pilus assembly protein PilF
MKTPMNAFLNDRASASPAETLKKDEKLGTVRRRGLSVSYSYSFGQFVLDFRKRALSRADSPVTLTPKAFDVLAYLVQNPNRLVTKEELLQAVWGDTFVEEGNLTQYISHLRRALGDNSEDARLIVTIARKGYQFTAEVVVVKDTPKKVGVQVPTAESSPADAQPALELPTNTAAPRVSKPWWKAATVGAFALILGVVGYLSWRHFRPVTPPGSGRIMLAVLPFENLTGDPNKEYIADGLTEETISQLGRLNPQRLGVIARTSVMRYKHKDEPLDQIGRDLSVQYVLENSLRQSGDRLRLTAQLIQMKDQTHLWAQDYDYSAKDILNVQDDVAKAVAREIQLRLTSQEQADLARPRPVKPEAFDAYLQGRSYFVQGNTDMAARYYERATQLDPSYARAWVGLSVARFDQVSKGTMTAKEGQPLAREAVDRALALDPNLAEVHTQIGRIKLSFDFDWVGADESIQRAIALEPGNPESLRLAASSAAYFGRFEQALEFAHRAVEVDPFDALSRYRVGWVEYHMGALDEAISDLKRAFELNPNAPGHGLLAEIHILQGRPQDALPEIEREQLDLFRLQHHAIAYFALRREKDADAALSELIEKYHAIAAFQIAEVYAFRKRPDEALDWLDRAYAQRDDALVLTKIDPLLKNLHGDPRFAAFLKKLKLST